MTKFPMTNISSSIHNIFRTDNAGRVVIITAFDSRKLLWRDHRFGEQRERIRIGLDFFNLLFHDEWFWCSSQNMV